MSLRLIVRPEAEGDILNAALWYEGREVGLGLELTAEIHAAVERALKNPLAYLLLRKQPHVRRILARRFPYRIFYVLRPGRHDCSCSPACCARRTALARAVVKGAHKYYTNLSLMPISRHQIVRSIKSLYQQIVFPPAVFQGEPSRFD
jgi:plasmid stabilization system protein ParE